MNDLLNLIQDFISSQWVVIALVVLVSIAVILFFICTALQSMAGSISSILGMILAIIALIDAGTPILEIMLMIASGVSTLVAGGSALEES